jgi:hypothetical protein
MVAKNQKERAVKTAQLLAQVAEALNECHKAGLKVKLKYGSVCTREGYVLSVDDGWVARTLVYTEFEPPNDGMDDE